MTKATYNQFFIQISNAELLREFITFHINKIDILSDAEKQMHIGNIPMVDDNIEPKQKAKAYMDFVNILEDKEGLARSVKAIIEITNKKYAEIVDGYISAKSSSKDKSVRVMYELVSAGDSKVESLVYLYLKNLEEFNNLYSVYFVAKNQSWKSYPVDTAANNMRMDIAGYDELVESISNSDTVLGVLGVKDNKDLYISTLEAGDADYVIISKVDKQKYEKINDDGTVDISGYEYNFELSSRTIVLAIIKSAPEIMIKSKLKLIDAYDVCTIVSKKLYNKDVHFYKRGCDISQFKIKKENTDLIVSSEGVSAWYMTGISLSSISEGESTSTPDDKSKKPKAPERKVTFTFRKSLGEPGNIKFWNTCESLGVNNDFSGYAVERVAIKFSISDSPNADVAVRMDKNGANINLLYKSGRQVERALIASSVISDWQEINTA